MRKILHEILAEQVSVTQGGKVKRMSKAEALIQLTMARGMKGDVKAIEGMLAFAEKIGRLNKPNEDGDIKPGVIIVPEKVSDEEWERLYGAAARGENHLNDPPPQRPKVTRPCTIEAIDVLTNDKKYDEALACYRVVLTMWQKTVAKDSENIEAQNQVKLAISRIAHIGVHFIVMGRLANAIDVLDQAINLEPTELRWQSLRALAFMLYGNVHQAKAIYLEHCDDKKWKADTLEDFKFARSRNFTHPFMDEIEDAFATGINVQGD